MNLHLNLLETKMLATLFDFALGSERIATGFRLLLSPAALQVVRDASRKLRLQANLHRPSTLHWSSAHRAVALCMGRSRRKDEEYTYEQRSHGTSLKLSIHCSGHGHLIHKIDYGGPISASGPIASFRCDAEFGRLSGHSGLWHAVRPGRFMGSRPSTTLVHHYGFSSHSRKLPCNGCFVERVAA